jgi:hypothetical protein
MEEDTDTMETSYTYADFTDEDYDQGILDYMGVPDDYYDEDERQITETMDFDLADEF